MRIKKIFIRNYKSIKNIEFEPTKGLNAFIGANSVGKSNVFSAISWVLGFMYPTFNSVKKEDHYMCDELNKIFIKFEFDDGHSLEMNEHKETINNRGETEIKSGLFYDANSYNCRGEIREKYCSAHLGTDREISEYLPSNRWSIMGRILQEVNRRFLDENYTHKGETKAKTEWLRSWLEITRDKLLFSVKDEDGSEIMPKLTSILQDESAKQLNRPTSDFSINLSLYDPWNYYRTLQLLVKEHDMGDLEFQASTLGMGVQASISIAILKAYSELNLANKSPIFIDEPELYLHPQAQRNFYKILREMSLDKYDPQGNLIKEGIQVFYTTHSPNFLSAGHFNEIFIVRKNSEKGTYLNFAEIKKFIRDLQIRRSITSNESDLLLHFKNAYENTGDTQKANEGFFAKKIILVEGQSEALILPYLFEKTGFDYIKEGISIVNCGGKNEIDRFFRLYNELGIPCFVIFDGDKHLAGTSEEENNKNKNREILTLFGNNSDYPDGIVKDRYLGFEYEFGKQLGYQATKKGLELFVEIKKKLEERLITIPTWANEVKSKIENMSEADVHSVLRN